MRACVCVCEREREREREREERETSLVTWSASSVASLRAHARVSVPESVNADQATETPIDLHNVSSEKHVKTSLWRRNVWCLRWEPEEHHRGGFRKVKRCSATPSGGGVKAISN